MEEPACMHLHPVTSDLSVNRSDLWWLQRVNPALHLSGGGWGWLGVGAEIYEQACVELRVKTTEMFTRLKQTAGAPSFTPRPLSSNLSQSRLITSLLHLS